MSYLLGSRAKSSVLTHLTSYNSLLVSGVLVFGDTLLGGTIPEEIGNLTNLGEFVVRRSSSERETG